MGAREHLPMPTSFTLLHRDGTRTRNPPLDDVLRLLGELRDGHGNVAVRHSTGWILRVHADGVVEFGNDARDDIAVRHLPGIAPAPLAELAEAIAVGSFYETLEHEWREGPRPSDPSSEDRCRRRIGGAYDHPTPDQRSPPPR